MMSEASSPGKVLILGGYLIVEAPNAGISIGVNARFTTRIVSASPATEKNKVDISISSPQFNQKYAFQCQLDDGDEQLTKSVKIIQTAGNPSPFLYHAILYAVSAAALCGNKIDTDISLELAADNDFYSQRNYLEKENMSVNVENLRKLPKHLPLIGEVSKTGLGSSAAMTTSVVACIFTHYHHKEGEKEFIHRIAQVAHSVSQGKIGSGFDVFTAVYGTCVYRRFPAEKVEGMVKGSEAPDTVEMSKLGACIDMKEDWVANKPFHLPKGIKLVLGDVHQGGSSTPGMVAKIMAWRKANAANTDNLWDKLRETNEQYIRCLHDLILQYQASPNEHAEAVKFLATVSGLPAHTPRNEHEALFVEASKCAALSRKYLREMGVAAGVKVEPEELTVLLDDTAAHPGVFAVGCPGAGGYDAIFALVLGEENCTAVEQFWENYKKISVCPLTVREDPGGLLVDGK